ncbi:MAG: HRDC domain-containing protein [Planctomycetota bacterium]|nr:HRDC domain-containing protein [Planctomycetota bacterium]
MEYTEVNQDDQLGEMIEVIAKSNLVGFDTEFVAEDCYQPDLCLLQLSTRDRIFIFDPKAFDQVDDLWSLLTDGGRTVIVHAGREETLFVQRATGKSMPKMFDVQVAVGFLGGEYPASYGKLLQRFLNINVRKGETRTDWRKRPLTRAQLDYAALDVLHLPELYDILRARLEETGRLGWLNYELTGRQQALVEFTRQESWYRISGVQSLQGQQLAIVRELWKWREERAQTKNMPARRVLRDDLIVELAKRGYSDKKQISQIRGLHHSGFQRFLPDIAQCVRNGGKTEVPETPWGGRLKRLRPPALLQQFLTAAMSFLCRNNEIAPAIVGTSDDVGRLASYWLAGRQLDEEHDDYPNLLRGWRKDFVGDPLHEIFLGKRALRVADPSSDMPLSLCDAEQLQD